MSRNLETQLRAYFEEFDSTLAPLEVELLTTQRVPKTAPRVERRPVPGWAVALGAFLTLLVAVGGVGLLINLGTDETTPVTEPPPTTVITTTTAATTTTSTPGSTTLAPEPALELVVGEAPLTWRRVDDTASTRFEESTIETMIPAGPGFVAVGTHQAATPDGGYAVDAAVWVSADGEAWERIESTAFGAGTDDPDSQLGTQWMSDVVTNGERIVAVGYDGYAAAVWTSIDGYSWERVVDDDLPPGTTDSYMNAVAVHEGGFISVGSHRSDAGIWMSPDGLDWTRIEDEDLLGDSSGQVGLRGVTAYGSGFVAVGDKGFANPGVSEEFDPLFAVSVDGRDWEAIGVVEEASGEAGLVLTSDLAARDMGGTAVRTRDGVLFATAWVGAGDGALLTSVDGRSWQVIPVPEGAAQGGLALSGDYLMTVDLYDGQSPAAWLATGDLTEWLVAPLDGMADLRTVVPFGSRLLLGGASFGEDGSDFRAGIWIGTWDR